MRHFVCISKRILDRQQFGIQVIFGKERPHIPQNAHTAHQRREQHRLRMQIPGRSNQSESSGNFLVTLFGFLRYNRSIDLLYRDKRCIQRIRVSRQERAERLSRISRIWELCPGKEILPEIIHSPCHIKPDIHPQQIFDRPPH